MIEDMSWDFCLVPIVDDVCFWELFVSDDIHML